MEVGDITKQGQGNYLPVPAVEIGSRDLTLATGTQSFTGIGFKPSAIYAFGAEAVVADLLAMGLINVNDQINRGLSIDQNGNTATEDEFLAFRETTGEVLGRVTSFDTDGFTITWTRTGSPTGTASFRFLIFK